MKQRTSPESAGLWTLTFGELGATLKALQDHGVTPQHLVRVRSDSKYAKRVAAFIRNQGAYDFSDHPTLDRNYFGFHEWRIVYGKCIPDEEPTPFPWDEDLLNSPCPFYKGKLIRETHFAFLGMESVKETRTLFADLAHLARRTYPLTITKLLALYPAEGQPRFSDYRKDLYYLQAPLTTKETCASQWYLMLRDVIPGSLNKGYDEQVALLPQEYEVPSAIEETLMHILFYHRHGAYPGTASWIRTRDIMTYKRGGAVSIEEECRLAIGSVRSSLRSGEISMLLVDKNCPYPNCGIAASRKPPQLT